MGGAAPTDAAVDGRGGASVGISGGSSGMAASDAASVTNDDAAGALLDGSLVVVHGDASAAACAHDRATLGSRDLLAGGSTPEHFAEAYNAELSNLTTGGPFLLVLSGVNDGSVAAKVATLGALKTTPKGSAFAETPAEVPFTMPAARSVRIAKNATTFELGFDAQAPDAGALVPVVSVELTGKLSSGCSALTTNLKLLIPVSSSAVAFHGSTIGALMGPPSEAVHGGANDAWPLELAGTASRVFTVVLGDGGPAEL